jgi:hypothetical protein
MHPANQAHWKERGIVIIGGANKWVMSSTRVYIMDSILKLSLLGHPAIEKFRIQNSRVK